MEFDDLKLKTTLVEFNAAMEQILLANDHKTGWDELSVHECFTHLKQELDELQTEYVMFNNNFKHGIAFESERNERLLNMSHEALDVANFCMFMRYNAMKQLKLCPICSYDAGKMCCTYHGSLKCVYKAYLDTIPNNTTNRVKNAIKNWKATPNPFDSTRY